MRDQRETLVVQLRQQMNSDDILHVMIGETTNTQDNVIDEHIQKHRETADLIRQNLSAQDNVLK